MEIMKNIWKFYLHFSTKDWIILIIFKMNRKWDLPLFPHLEWKFPVVFYLSYFDGFPELPSELDLVWRFWPGEWRGAGVAAVQSRLGRDNTCRGSPRPQVPRGLHGGQAGRLDITSFFNFSRKVLTLCYTWGYPISPPRPSVVTVRFNGGQLCSGGQTCVAATTSTTSTTSSSDSPGCCGGDSFTDLLCNDVPNDPHGGLGCKACGVQDCRLCGGPVYIPCP